MVFKWPNFSDLRYVACWHERGARSLALVPALPKLKRADQSGAAISREGVRVDPSSAVGVDAHGTPGLLLTCRAVLADP